MKKRKPALRNTAPAPVAPAIPGETVARVAQRQADMDEERRLRRRTGDTAVSRLVVSGVPGDAPARRDVPGAIPGDRFRPGARPASSTTEYAPLPPPSGRGLLEPSNMDMRTRPDVPVPGGGRASVRSISIGTERGEVVIPTVSDDGRLLSDEEAIALFLRSGRHLGVYDNPRHATSAAQEIHRSEARRGALRRASLGR